MSAPINAKDTATMVRTLLCSTISALLIACDAQVPNQPQSASIELPAQLRQIHALNPADLRLHVSINNASPFTYSGQGSEAWNVSLHVPAGDSFTLQISWYASYQNQQLLLAQQNIRHQGATSALHLDLAPGYQTSGSAFDADLDGRSNLSEMRDGTNPTVADVISAGNYQEPQLVSVTAGCAVIGSPPDEPERFWFEEQHQVCVQDFQMGRFEVTFAEFDLFANDTGRTLPETYGTERGNYPVVNVSYLDAQAYANWLSLQSNKNYRLPTEAEWEYAARAGTTTIFHTGNQLLDSQACFDATEPFNGAPAGSEPPNSCIVGSYPANPWGLHDMLGNVSEWTCSEYDAAYGGSELTCATSVANNTSIAVRNSSWRATADNLRAARRYHTFAEDTYIDTGFRLVLDTQ